MPTATETNTTPTRRRALFGAAAVTVSTVARVPALASVNPDAELIAIGREAAPLSGEFERLQIVFHALPSGDPAIEQVSNAGDQPFDRLNDLAKQAIPLRATTLNGLSAKAILLRHLMLLEFGVRHVFVSDGSALTDLTWSLICDLTAGSAAA